MFAHFAGADALMDMAWSLKSLGNYNQCASAFRQSQPLQLALISNFLRRMQCLNGYSASMAILVVLGRLRSQLS